MSSRLSKPIRKGARVRAFTRDDVFAAVAARVAPHRAGRRENGGLCLYWAHYALEELARVGVRACLQAGTCYWPRLPKERWGGPDPVEVFGFEFNLHTPATAAAVLADRLPELHAWVGIPATQEVVDFSTGDWPDLCRTMLGVDWPGPTPPKYFWGRGTDRPDGVVYDASKEPTILTGLYLDSLKQRGTI